MKKTLQIIFLISLFSCSFIPENKGNTKIEDTVKQTPAKVEDTVEMVEESSSKEEKEIIEVEREAFVPSPFIAKILKQLDIQPVEVYDEFIVQKVLPYETASTVVVIPTIASLEDDGYSFSLNSYILVVDSETAAIKQKFYESNSWYSDAIRIEEVSIDTANYKVTDNKRAFGIELYYIGASRPNPYNSRTLSLFIQEESKLIKVLDSFETKSYWGEWDMRCTGEFIDVNKIFIMDANQSEGFYDIMVRVETTTMETFEKGEDDCDEKETTKKSKQLLKYANGSYEIHKKTYTLETESPCKLTVVLEDNRYYLKTNKREHSGTFLVKDGSITFEGLLTDEPKVEVQGAYYENEIVIQNYGNSMNPFIVFGECDDQKYLHLRKKE
ncbi:hypothetical protein [uncultured Aquimarina sp.]|uniref:hypothetical protein n=1 Tax=uncultured Aquimarina sp. TaxID=575652 RepID=UPI002607AFB7|nr:hypothetical protein [uncultured Aquimarina sp.]